MGIRERCEHYAKIKTPHRQIPLTTVKDKITIYDDETAGELFFFSDSEKKYLGCDEHLAMFLHDYLNKLLDLKYIVKSTPKSKRKF